MSVNTPASWSEHGLRTWLGLPSGLAALQGLTRLNVLLTSATENESPQSFGVGRVGFPPPELVPHSFMHMADLEFTRLSEYVLDVSVSVWQHVNMLCYLCDPAQGRHDEMCHVR